jgi:hypothetical protein
MKEITRVLKNKILIGIIAGSAALIPLAGIAATSSPAGAKATGITCTTTTGKVNSTSGVAKITESGCSGNTGGSGTTKGSATSTSSTVKWHNGTNTVLDETATPDGTKCTNPNTIEDEVITGTVSSDTTGSTKPGAAITGEICALENTTTGKVTIVGAPGVDFKIAKKA